MARSDRPIEFYIARRERREARWNRPIGSTRERMRAWIDLLFVDHGALRLMHLNAHRVTPTLWRSAQPSPRDIARMAGAGLKTIVNLRGGRSRRGGRGRGGGGGREGAARSLTMSCCAAPRGR